MIAGIKLDIFSRLSNCSKTADELAGELQVNTRKLSPLLYILVGAELLQVESERFSNTHESETFLVQGKPDYCL